MEYNSVITNRSARRDFFVIETLEAGLELRGTEVKSIRSGKASLAESFAKIEEGEIYLYHMHVNPYEYDSKEQDALRPKKVLLHRKQIEYLSGQVLQKRLTLIPLKTYFKNGFVKVELGLCQGKKQYDKRESIKKRESDRALARAKRTKL
jgi:SsrA-binding protein